MTYDIRPLSFGEILDRSFRVYLDNFAVLFGISAVVLIPAGILLSSGFLIGNGPATILDFLFLIVAAPAMHAALTVGVAEAYLGRPVTIAEAYQTIRPIFLPFIGTYFLLALVFIFPAALFGGLLGFLNSFSGVIFVLALIAGATIGIYFLVCCALVGPVMIVERRFGMAALKRSRELMLGSWWLTIGILITAGLIANVPAGALKFVWGFIPVLGVILTAATQAAASAYSMIALMIYYFDRRCRTEEFDLRLLAEQIRAQSGPISAAVPESSSLA